MEPQEHKNTDRSTERCMWLCYLDPFLLPSKSSLWTSEVRCIIDTE